MATQAMPLTTKISQSTTGKTTPKILTVRFGNGYEQRSPDGINYTEEEWNISWENLTSAEMTTVLNTFSGARWGADVHTWTPPGSATSKKYVYKEHDLQVLSGNLYTIQATFRQVYDQ